MPFTLITTAGTSRVEVEEPDLVIYRMSGKLTAAALRTLRGAEEQWSIGKRHLLILVDATEQTELPFETRKAASEPPKGTPNRAVAIYGVNAAIRISTNMVLRALDILLPNKLISRLFDDEASALQWLYEQRPRLEARADAFDLKPK